MKMTAIALLLSGGLHVATKGMSQEVKVTLRDNRMRLDQFFRQLEKLTKYRFFYSIDRVPLTSTISVQANNEPLLDLLQRVLPALGLSYKQVNDSLITIGVITAADTKNTTTANNSNNRQDGKIVLVKGQVFDNAGAPMAGVAVSERKSGRGVITDKDGRFAINARLGGLLQFSFVGYIQTQLNISSTGNLKVSLQPVAQDMEEVVVIGYGAIKRKDITNAVSRLNMADINISANANFTQALAGRAPGLLATQTTGQPGAAVDIQIRDNPSFASAGVLYVLDGVPINNAATDPANNPEYGSGGIDRSPLNFINPYDIESIEVLKDASAAAIYGAQAGAGVVLITTKKGKAGKPRLEYAFSHAFQRQGKFYALLGTKEYMEQRNKIQYEMWLRDNDIVPYGDATPSSASVPPFVPKYTQAQIDSTPVQPSAMKAISRGGMVQQHNLSLTGGNDRGRYYISGNYFNQTGLLKGSDYTRYNGRVNMEQFINRRLKVGANIVSSNSKANNPAIQTGRYEDGGIMMAAWAYPANQPLRNADGSYPLSADYPNIPNPLSYLQVTDQSQLQRLLTNGYATWEIIPGLKAQADFSYDQSREKRSVYMPKSFLFGMRSDGMASIGETNSSTQLIDYTLCYTKGLGNRHRINALAGYSYQVNNGEGMNAQSNGFISDDYLYNNIGSGTGTRPVVGSFKNRQTWASYFARVIYTLSNRYTLTASVRRDGASNFAENKKYAYFPSVSAGWQLSEEPFFTRLRPLVNNMRLRASYGFTGNSNIGSNAFAYYATTPAFGYVFGNIPATGITLSQISNPNLTWETVRELNAGIDFELLKSRLSGTVDYYHKTISQLLTFIPLPTDYAVAAVAGNAGRTGTHGWEISLHSQNILSCRKLGFRWNTDLMLSHFYSFWKQRPEASLKNLAKFVDPRGQFDDEAVYGYISEGLFKGKGKPPAAMPGLIPGGIMLRDLDGFDANGNLTGKPDGQLSSADQRYIGSRVPKYSFGFNNTFSYAGFDLSVYFYGTSGAVKSLTDDAFSTWMETNMAQYGWNTLAFAKNRWSYDNTGSRWESGLRTGYENYTVNSDFWYQKAGFIRCRDITLGYAFPQDWIKKQNTLNSIRLSVGVQNPFVITGYTGLDPELQSFLAYPMARSVIISLNTSF